MRLEAAVSPIQLNDPGIRLCQAALVADDVVSNRQAFVAAGLSGQDSLGLLPRLRIAIQEPIDLGLLVAIDDKDTVDKTPQSGSDK